MLTEKWAVPEAVKLIKPDLLQIWPRSPHNSYNNPSPLPYPLHSPKLFYPLRVSPASPCFAAFSGWATGSMLPVKSRGWMCAGWTLSFRISGSHYKYLSFSSTQLPVFTVFLETLLCSVLLPLCWFVWKWSACSQVSEKDEKHRGLSLISWENQGLDKWSWISD